MKKEDFYYELPEELIAQHPLKNREKSRLMVLDRETGETKDRHFEDILEYLNPGDCMVLNDTRVIPARLFGSREGKKESIEFLLLKRIEDDKWETLVRPGKKARPGHKIVFGEGKLQGEILSIEEDGTRIIDFSYKGIFEEILDELGEMPLPPYIQEKLEDKERYQTVYSKNKGSAAAPTAGLHFTKELLGEIKNRGVNIVYITLHVGLGTFRPVKVENIEEHHMHEEYFEVSKEAANIINRTKENSGKVVAVGTTSTRTLESIANDDGKVIEGKGWTNIFIYPGYRFKVVDSLITNFHLPESTLIMLVSALAGRENTLNAYNRAVEKKYRFFSFGDAMLIK
ncbi:tRNA preQ1(34) S-adenosylmethionine ribosyltransferase-isomerase QueA [Anaerosalibacter bizertensis]|uniref:S-adenosylmethionine:tRNA ribosyltransferase-isomerase n=1 Tax=Anaerosalibacter bizertensis TaxID=932217 RepID=A0A844FJL9_9FIRM|nr:tRNA preQ1(34) S-adenosylmethionine ribosyltransferase-isomerase QueA [Anaerosalibacter bizertensis]MBV1817440.1 tRNA preQ1(34) S-adenosylmethionine ribosyltransferase-isomerase QueA [Bacteroidales bacterium MSK.15.36]HHV27772.1 tRNA preQ1(34) S-adenosylmethionine ribosyltransferase-isomerase QueA [Tissierellia bacterium]MCB5559260.1 tRNA preQ1(34) S-adenosylmethionine ribosyltransferase-isomerase QueA [Anaerosalibacter bizertensis]MCG4564048.1 tRNA preQ1(34) S-adenosylmethionine ribosyltran